MKVQLKTLNEMRSEAADWDVNHIRFKGSEVTWIINMNHLAGKTIEITQRIDDPNTFKHNYINGPESWTITDNMIKLTNRNGANS